MPFQKKVWQFNDIITEDELNRMEQGIEDSITAIEEHTNNTNNPHGVTAEQIGAETPAGAQAKANAALDAAKNYTDQEVAKVVDDLASHKNETAQNHVHGLSPERVRAIYVSPNDPDDEIGEDGDIWIKYEE